MGRLNDLVRESYKIAKERGWHDEERSLSALTLLMQSEVSEILEEYRKHKGLTEIWYEVHQSKEGVEVTMAGGPGDKPCGIPIELADLVIRVADYCGRYNIDLESWADPAPHPIMEDLNDFEEWLARITYALSMARFDKVLGVAFWLGITICYSFSMATVFGIDLWAAIDEKTAFNRTRPYRHGGKRI